MVEYSKFSKKLMSSDTKNSTQTPGEEDVIDLWDYVEVLVRRRRMILRNCLVVFFSVMVISLFLPKSYTAITTLLPPERTDQRDFLSAFSEIPLSNLGLTTGNTKSELFVEILKSRTVSQGVLKRKYLYKGKEQTLLEIWGTKSLEQAQKKLAQNSKFT
ncbi:MAG: Wzz/FepE/Etk N-terminal domain-containing protein, partial [candidate division KSB1 bacterium]|nr:Wzz/FepE/Etk N-terminal domain-containing protein [candidate division KSB1 bacterium]